MSGLTFLIQVVKSLIIDRQLVIMESDKDGGFAIMSEHIASIARFNILSSGDYGLGIPNLQQIHSRVLLLKSTWTLQVFPKPSLPQCDRPRLALFPFWIWIAKPISLRWASGTFMRVVCGLLAVWVFLWVISFSSSLINTLISWSDRDSWLTFLGIYDLHLPRSCICLMSNISLCRARAIF